MITTYRARPRRGLFVGVLIVYLGAGTLACGSGQGRDTSTASASQQPGASAVDGAAPLYRPKGTLPKTIDALTPDEFAAFVDELNWTGHYHQRDCEGTGCSATTPARVLLEAIDDAHKVDVTKLPANGVLMARMINVGKVAEAHYKLPAESGEWYFFYYPATDGPKFDLIRLTFDSQVAPRIYHRAMGASVNGCTPAAEHPTRPRASAGFSQCDPKPATWTRDLIAPSKNVWISCSLGCCSSGYPTFSTAADSAAHPFQPDPL